MLKQICVIEVNGNPRYPDAPSIPLTVLVNPMVTPLDRGDRGGWEGCLSVPDMRGMVPRVTAVRLEACDRDGERIDLVAKEFFARVIQHETDHLNGIVYLDRMKRPLDAHPPRGVEQVLAGHPGAGRLSLAEDSRAMPGRVIAGASKDLFFVARIRETARLVGDPARLRPHARRDPRRPRRAIPLRRFVLIDLTTPGWDYARGLRGHRVRGQGDTDPRLHDPRPRRTTKPLHDRCPAW